MDKGAWQATVHGVAKSQIRLSYKAQHSATLEIHMSHMEGLIYFIEMFLFQIFK